VGAERAVQAGHVVAAAVASRLVIEIQHSQVVQTPALQRARSSQSRHAGPDHHDLSAPHGGRTAENSTGGTILCT